MIKKFLSTSLGLLLMLLFFAIGETAYAATLPKDEVCNREWNPAFETVKEDRSGEESLDSETVRVMVYESTPPLEANVVRGERIEFAAPIREGYIFEGWYLDKKLEIPFDGVVNTLNSELIIYPKYNRQKCKLKIQSVQFEYIYNGTAIKFESVETETHYEYGRKIVLSDLDVTLKNHKLMGFSKDGETLTSEFSIKKDEILIPIFGRVKFSVVYFGIDDKILHKEDVAIYDLPTYNYIEENKYYMFDGWAEPLTQIVEDSFFTAKYIRYYNKFYYYNDEVIFQIFETAEYVPELKIDGYILTEIILTGSTAEQLIYIATFEKQKYQLLYENNDMYTLNIQQNLYWGEDAEFSISFKNQNYELNKIAIVGENISLTILAQNHYKFVMPQRDIRLNISIREKEKTLTIESLVDNFNFVNTELDFLLAKEGLGVGANILYIKSSQTALDLNLYSLPKGEYLTLSLDIKLQNGLKNPTELNNYNLYLFANKGEVMLVLKNGVATTLEKVELDGKSYFKLPISVEEIHLILVKQKEVNAIGIALIVVVLGVSAFFVVRKARKTKKEKIKIPRK